MVHAEVVPHSTLFTVHVQLNQILEQSARCTVEKCDTSGLWIITGLFFRICPSVFWLHNSCRVKLKHLGWINGLSTDGLVHLDRVIKWVSLSLADMCHKSGQCLSSLKVMGAPILHWRGSQDNSLRNWHHPAGRHVRYALHISISTPSQMLCRRQSSRHFSQKSVRSAGSGRRWWSCSVWQPHRFLSSPTLCKSKCCITASCRASFSPGLHLHAPVSVSRSSHQTLRCGSQRCYRCRSTRVNSSRLCLSSFGGCWSRPLTAVRLVSLPRRPACRRPRRCHRQPAFASAQTLSQRSWRWPRDSWQRALLRQAVHLRMSWRASRCPCRSWNFSSQISFCSLSSCLSVPRCVMIGVPVWDPVNKLLSLSLTSSCLTSCMILFARSVGYGDVHLFVLVALLQPVLRLALSLLSFALVSANAGVLLVQPLLVGVHCRCVPTFSPSRPVNLAADLGRCLSEGRLHQIVRILQSNTRFPE